MFGLSFPKFKSMAALQRAAETLQKMRDAAKQELADRVDAKKNKISSDPETLELAGLAEPYKPDSPYPFDGFRSHYRNEELTEDAIQAGFRGARTMMAIMQAEDACRASPHFKLSDCISMAMDAKLRSMAAPKDHFIHNSGNATLELLRLEQRQDRPARTLPGVQW